jgi:hypothetical protein
MVPVADGRLRQLCDQCLRVAQQEMQHRCTIEFVLDRLRFQAIALAGALHDRTARRRFAAHEQGDADDAFIADHGDLGRGAVLHHIQQRDDCCRRKVDVTKHAARFVEHLAERQVDPFELGFPALPFGIRQSREQLVLSGVADSEHWKTPQRTRRRCGRVRSATRTVARQRARYVRSDVSTRRRAQLVGPLACGLADLPTVLQPDDANVNSAGRIQPVDATH